VAELDWAWHEGWLWLGGSLLAAILWTNLVWLFRQPPPGVVSEYVARLLSWPFSPWLFQLLRLLYYVGLPFAALFWGHDAVVGRILGLKQLVLPAEGNVSVCANWLDWTRDVGWAASLGIGVWALLALGWWAYRRALSTIGAGDAVAGTGSSAWTLLREAAYHQVHWAFYRNAPVIALERQFAGGRYWGVWIGLALVALEAAFNPAWRNGLTDPRRAPSQLTVGALAAVSSVLFLQTENLWLALVVHWGVSWGLAALARWGVKREA
jgi:hypothetical protein